ncbi:lysine transporter LysE [Streptomyces sp. NPDC056367]|uniref:lysine transporter LysE n=1 Tax=Streptomyces sp. NPDC056367 TaxID=3345797 RepID=UPI0035DC9306
MRVRKVVKGIGDFLVELVGETVGELILNVIATALLAGLTLIAYLSWSFSPRLTVAGAGLLSLFLAHGARRSFRRPAKGHRSRLAAVTTAGFALTAATAVFLLFYAEF